MLADRETDRQTDRRVHHDTSHSYWERSENRSADVIIHVGRGIRRTAWRRVEITVISTAASLFSDYPGDDASAKRCKIAADDIKCAVFTLMRDAREVYENRLS